MVRLTSLIVLLIVTPLYADQATSVYKRDKLLVQLLFNKGGVAVQDTSTHAYITAASGTGQADVTGKHGGAISFDGNGGVSLPATEATPENEIQDFTIVASIRMDSSDTTTRAIWLQAGGLGGAWAFGIRRGFLYGHWDCITDYCSEARVENIDDRAIAITTGVWTHVAWTSSVDRGESVIYVNGKIASRQVRSDNNCDRADVIEIGTNTGGASNNFLGSFDEIAVWKEGFTNGEVKQLYKQWVGRQSFLQ